MSLGAMKKFKQSTDRDLWHLMISFIEAYARSLDENIITKMKMLYSVCDFETASIAIHCMLEDKSIPLDEIQDAMFRVGWMPNQDEDSEMSEPWPLMIVSMAYEIDQQFNDVNGKKKEADTSEQLKEKSN